MTTATATIARLGRRRAPGSISAIEIAATADRKLATCQPVSDVALIAALPVENRAAAASTSIGAQTLCGSSSPFVLSLSKD